MNSIGHRRRSISPRAAARWMPSAETVLGQFQLGEVLGVCAHGEHAVAGRDGTVVERSEPVELGGSPVDEVLAAVGGPTEQVRDPGGRQDLGEIGDGVEAPAFDEAVDERIGDGLRIGPQIGERSRSEGSPDDLPLRPMFVAVAHERGPTAQAVDELVERDTLTGDECGMVAEDSAALRSYRVAAYMSWASSQTSGPASRSARRCGYGSSRASSVKRSASYVAAFTTSPTSHTRFRIVPIPSIQVSST